MPEDGIKLISHNEILSFDKITEIVTIAIKSGINKIRITGGEPLVRKNIVTLISMISMIEGIEELTMTTNGVLLSQYAEELHSAGLNRVNISLDTIHTEKYKIITRGGDINKVFDGINSALKYKLTPVKINCVKQEILDDKDYEDLKQYCFNKGLKLQFIQKMNLKNGDFSYVEGGEGGNCEMCNRIRLTSNGKIKPCLFNNLEFDVNKLGIKEAIIQAIQAKPEFGTNNQNSEFYNIGG